MTAVAEPQHMAALRRANEVRLAKAEIKRQVGAGEMSARELLTDVPSCCEKVAIEELLMWLPRVGQSKARKMLMTVGVYVSPTIPVGVLGERTREAIILRIERGR